MSNADEGKRFAWERERFEAWLALHLGRRFHAEFDLARDPENGEYKYNPAADYWRVWQARAAQPAPVVPEGVTIERDIMGVMHIKLGDFDFIQIQYQYPHTDNASTRQLAERIAAMLAAAPAQGQQVEWRTTAVMLEQANAGLAQLNGKLRAELSTLKAHPEAYQFDGQVLRDEHGNYLAEFMAYEQSFIDRLLHPQPELKAQQVGQEPAGEVHLRKGGGISLLHVELAQPLPPGTKLYTAPQPALAQGVAGLVELLREADQELKDWQDVWPDCHDKATSDIRGRIAIALSAHDKQSGGE